VITFILVVISAVLGFLLGERRGNRNFVPAVQETRPVGDGAGTDHNTAVVAALEALTVGVVVASPRGEVIFRNQLARGITGAVHSDVLLDEAIDIHLKAAVNGVSGGQVLDLFGPPRRVLSVSARPLESGGAVAMVEDTTERSLLDAVRTDFVANISHELKTPIGALILLAEAISDSDDDEVVKRLSSKMVSESVRAGRAIDDLLELSRIELGGVAVKDPVSVEQVLAESVDRCRSLSERHRINVEIGLPNTPLKVIGDRRQMVSAVGNLIENAIKYSDEGSSIEVTASSNSQMVDIVVRDHGIGIPSRDIDRIFERFYRVDRARSRETGGTGLGLAIVRHVATNHNGEVSVTSVEGEGSVFTLRLPAVKSNPATSNLTSSVSMQSTHESQRN